jgi:hypothetical protein
MSCIDNKSLVPCIENKCSCIVEIESKCVTVVGDFPCSSISSGLPLSQFLEELDSFICTKFSEVSNYLTLISVGNGVSVYSGIDGLGRKKIRSLISSDNSVFITENNDNIDITVDITPTPDGSETKIIEGNKTSITGIGTVNSPYVINSDNEPTYDSNNVGTGNNIFKNTTFLGIDKTFNFKTLKFESVGVNSIIKEVTVNENDLTLKTKGHISNTLAISEEGDNIRFEIPSVFQGVDYYVNSVYQGDEELGTPSKPFRSLKNCIDRILNRVNSTIGTPFNTVNGGNAYTKWDLRSGLAEGSVRIIIQSYSEISENIAINRVEYFLERGGYNSVIAIPANANLSYILDMKELVDNVVKVSGKLPYELNCTISGKGVLIFSEGNTTRKGFVRSYGFNDGNLSVEQNDSNLFFGSVGGDIQCIMFKNPNLNYTTLYKDNGNTIPITREGVTMTGYQTTSTPDYGAIETEGSNAQFSESLFLSGTILVSCFEQHMLYAKNSGTIYGDNGRIYMRRSYQHVTYSNIEVIDVNPGVTSNLQKFYKPSEHVYDIYLKNKGNLSYAGDFYTQGNTGANQGGPDSFVCLENNTTDASKMSGIGLLGGAEVTNLLYNHYFKSILNPIFNDFQHNNSTFKQIKIDSYLFKEAISCVDTTNSIWTKIITFGKYVDCYIQDLLLFGNVRKPFSNLQVNDKLLIQGTTIGLSRGEFNSSYPNYIDNADAVSKLYTVGGIYRDGTGLLRVVI